LTTLDYLLATSTNDLFPRLSPDLLDLTISQGSPERTEPT